MIRTAWQAGAIVIACAVGLPVQLLAQAVDPALPKAAEARAVARDAGDAEVYGRYILEDAVITNGRGMMETRASRMKAIRGNPSKAAKPKISDERYRMLGDAAIRTWREDTNADGATNSTRWIEVWVKQKGEWKLASLQFTAIQPK